MIGGVCLGGNVNNGYDTLPHILGGTLTEPCVQEGEEE